MVCITQYKKGIRVPKFDMVHKMEEILKVNLYYLMTTAPSTLEEIMQTLLFLDEENGVRLSVQEVITENGKENLRRKIIRNGK